MCGIYGYKLNAGVQLTEREHATVHAICAAAMEERGSQSYGYAAMSRKGSVYVQKGVGSITTSGAALIPRTAHSGLFIGHTRYATTGKLVAANAHPFRIGNVIGVHNGIIANHEQLNKTLVRECSVDSQHIFASIAEDRELSDLEGYGAIVWTDPAGAAIQLGRFNGGQLAIARVYRGARKADASNLLGVFFCSLATPLDTACSMAGLDAHFVSVPEDQWMSIHDGEVFTSKADRIGIRRTWVWDSRTVGKAATSSGAYNNAQQPQSGGATARTALVAGYAQPQDRKPRWTRDDDTDGADWMSADRWALGNADDDSAEEFLLLDAHGLCDFCQCKPNAHLGAYCAACGMDCDDDDDDGDDDGTDSTNSADDAAEYADSAYVDDSSSLTACMDCTCPMTDHRDDGDLSFCTFCGVICGFNSDGDGDGSSDSDSSDGDGSRWSDMFTGSMDAETAAAMRRELAVVAVTRDRARNSGSDSDNTGGN